MIASDGVFDALKYHSLSDRLTKIGYSSVFKNESRNGREENVSLDQELHHSPSCSSCYWNKESSIEANY